MCTKNGNYFAERVDENGKKIEDEEKKKNMAITIEPHGGLAVIGKKRKGTHVGSRSPCGWYLSADVECEVCCGGQAKRGLLLEVGAESTRLVQWV